jgi:Protein of unknown function (DUF2889)
MPLSKAPPRRLQHLRDIQLRGYEREDGLIDVEAHITDIKAYGAGRTGTLTAGEPMHDMWLRVTLDHDMVIQDCEAVMDATPYDICPGAAANYGRLKGLKIGRGFIKAAMQRLGGTEGCTHLRELLQPIGTVAFQTVNHYQNETIPARRHAIEPELINTCYAYNEHGAMITEFRARTAANQPD